MRALTGPGHLRIGVCWMLTQPDGRTDGRFLTFLRHAQRYRHYDPELFDGLRGIVELAGDRRVVRIERSGLLGAARFQSRILVDSDAQRRDYFTECTDLFAGCDLVFFDPDNGMEVSSVRRGRKNCCKYLYWDEARSCFMSGSSLLIYQHFPRENRADFIVRRARELQSKTAAASVLSIRTPHVLFLLAARPSQAEDFRRKLRRVEVVWGDQMRVTEH